MGRRPGTLSHMAETKAGGRRADSGPKTTEPRWPAVLALLALGGLHSILPEALRFGPDWLLIVIVTALLVPTIVAHRTGRHSLNHALSHLVLCIVTLSTIWSLIMLIMRLPAHRETPQELL